MSEWTTWGQHPCPAYGYGTPPPRGIPGGRSYEQLVSTYTGTEGQSYTVSEGGSFKWSAVLSAAGLADRYCWVRDAYYDAVTTSALLLSRVVGDVTPASETPAHSETALGNGTITASGGYVRYDTTADDSSNASRSINTGHAGSVVYWAGAVAVSSHTCATDHLNAHRCATSGDGTKYPYINLHHHTAGALRPINFTNTVIGSAGAGAGLPDLTAGEAWIECLLTAAGGLQIWVDHEGSVSWSVPYASLYSLSSRFAGLGDTTFTAGQGQQLITERHSIIYGNTP